MATLHFILGIVCLVGALGHRLPDRHLLTGSSANERILTIARSQLGVRENGKNNHGLQVSRYLAYTRLKEGNPWCAAFVSWVYAQAGYTQPRTAWSPALFPLAKRRTKPQVAAIFGLYFPSLKRIAHCGIVESCKGDWIVSIEGNTNGKASRDGDGVYRKWRHQKTIALYADWLAQKGVPHE